MKIDPQDQRILLDKIADIRSFIENLEVQKSCKSCEHYIDNAQICEKYRQSPPEHIKPVGCPSWSLHEIPF